MFGIDEALINAYAAYANTNNPDDRAKIKNLYDSFKKGKISKSEFDKGINYYIQSNGDVGAYPAKNFDYTAGHSVNRDELRNAADRYENVKPVLNGEVAPVPAPVSTRLIRDFIGNFIPGGSALMQGANIGVLQHNAESFANIGDSGAPAPADNKDEVAKLADAGKADSTAKANIAKQEHPEMSAVMQAGKAQGKSEVPNSSAVSDANAAKTQANAYDPSVRLNNNVQYVMNILKTYGYTQPVLDSFKQNIDKILANTKDNNKIDTANKYIDQFLGDKQDLRRQDLVPGKPALDQQPQKAGKNNKPGKKSGMSDAEIDAFLKEELGGDTTGNGTYASSGVPKGGTKTIGYDPNPDNVSLAYAMGNAPEQERRAALIDEWNREHGISYATGKDGVIYRTDPQHPNGYVDPFKNDLSTWTRATRSSSTYASPSISTGGTYATGEGIKDANGNVLTNPGGNWEYQYALRDPAYGLGMRDRMSDAQRNYWQAVAHDMGYNYDR